MELKPSQDLKQLRRSMEENVQTHIKKQELATLKTVLVTFFFKKFRLIHMQIFVQIQIGKKTVLGLSGIV